MCVRTRLGPAAADSAHVSQCHAVRPLSSARQSGLRCPDVVVTIAFRDHPVALLRRDLLGGRTRHRVRCGVSSHSARHRRSLVALFTPVLIVRMVLPPWARVGSMRAHLDRINAFEMPQRQVRYQRRKLHEVAVGVVASAATLSLALSRRPLARPDRIVGCLSGAYGSQRRSTAGCGALDRIRFAVVRTAWPARVLCAGSPVLRGSDRLWRNGGGI